MPHRPDGDFSHSRLVLCEGPEDVSFVSALIKEHNLPTMHLRHTGSSRTERGGKSRFGERLSRLTANTSFRKHVRHILIRSDSDNNEQHSFHGVRQQIRNAGFSAPTMLREPGTGDPAIAVFMLPPGGAGCLECYLQDAARSANQFVADRVDEFVGNVTVGQWTEVQRGKLWLRAALAASWRADPCINLAPLLGKNDQPAINLSHQSLNGLVTFLRTFGA